MTTTTVNLSLRLDGELVEQADALIPALELSPMAAFGTVKRASVLRAAVIEGLAVLREKYGDDGEVAR